MQSLGVSCDSVAGCHPSMPKYPGNHTSVYLHVCGLQVFLNVPKSIERLMIIWSSLNTSIREVVNLFTPT